MPRNTDTSALEGILEAPEAGEEIAGVPVKGWVTLTALAEDFLLISDRQIQRLERKGLPSKGSGHTKRYPIPHAFVWYSEYAADQAVRQAQGKGNGAPFLDVRVAMARHHLFHAELDATAKKGQG